MLGIEELLELEEILREVFDNNLEEILVKLNRSDSLADFLQLIDMSELLQESEATECNNTGKIIVIGQSEVDKKKLEAVAKNLGIDKNRFEFCLNYEDAKTYNFQKTRWSDAYSAILVGQMPHSGKAKGDFSSIISAIEEQDGYPPIYRIGLSRLKITKTAFRETLENLIQEKRIA